MWTRGQVSGHVGLTKSKLMTGHGSRWPAGRRRRRRWFRPRADELLVPFEPVHHEGPKDSGAAPVRSPELDRRRGTAAASIGDQTRRRSRPLSSMPSTRGGRGAHPEHAGLDGDYNGGQHRRNCSLPASGKTSSSETIPSTAVIRLRRIDNFLCSMPHYWWYLHVLYT